jgi:hypothetical protein
MYEIPAARRQPIFRRMEILRKCVCLHCQSTMKWASLVSHCQTYHQELMKLSSFDLVPGVDFLHVDHFEWATFVLKYF